MEGFHPFIYVYTICIPTLLLLQLANVRTVYVLAMGIINPEEYIHT